MPSFSGTCFLVSNICKGGGVTPLIRNFFCVLPHGVILDIAAIAVKLKCWRKLGVNQQIVVQTSADPANWFNQALSGLTLESEGCFHFKPCTLFNCPSCQVQLRIQYICIFFYFLIDGQNTYISPCFLSSVTSKIASYLLSRITI